MGLAVAGHRINPKAIRIGLVLLFAISALTIAWASGALDHVDVATVRAVVDSWGAWSIVAFLAIACLANIAYLPGMIPVVAAILAFGGWEGALIGWIGSTLSCMFTFGTMRIIGGKGTAEVKNKLLARMLGGLERRPVWTVTIVRALFQNSPIVNTILALSPVSTRGFFVGSALGMIPPVLIAAFFTNLFVG